MPAPSAPDTGALSRTVTPRRQLGVMLVVTGALMFIVNAGVSRVALRNDISPMELTSIRITGTFVALAIAAALVDRSALRLPRGRDLLLVVGLGLFGVAILQFAYFVAIDRLAIGLALLLEYQAPFIVALWAKFVQKSPVTARLWWGLALAVLGLAAATEIWEGASFDGIGVLAGVVAAFALASYFLFGESCHAAGMSSLRTMTWGFGVASVVMNVVSPVWTVQADVTAQVSLLGALEEWSVPLWVVLAWVVLLGTLAPFGLELLALRFIPATVVTAIAMLEPVGAAGIGWAWHGETLSTIAVVGCVTVVLGILIAQSARLDHPDDPPPLTP